MRIRLLSFAALLSVVMASPAFAAKVSLLKDIRTDSVIRPTYFGRSVRWGTKIAFVVNDGLNGAELWVTDGSASGTRMIKDLKPGNGSSDPQRLTVVGNHLYFTAVGDNGRELWRSDGTSDGTRQVRDLLPGIDSSDPQDLTALNSLLVFSALDVSGQRRLFRTDGTADGTWPLSSGGLLPTKPSVERGGLIVTAGNRVFYAFSDETHGEELWATDGTLAGTRLVKDIAPGVASSDVRQLVSMGASAYFAANDGASGLELWKSDGTPEGTFRVKDAIPGPNGLTNPVTYVLGNVLLMTHQKAGGDELYRTTGAVEDLSLVTTTATDDSSLPSLVLNGVLYYVTRNSTSGEELWRTDGTAPGTFMVKDIYPGAGSSSPRQLTGVGQRVAFIANDGVHGDELWVSDGTSQGTLLVKDAPNFETSPNKMFGTTSPTNELLYGTYRGLYKSDLTETGTALLTPVSQVVSDSNPQSFQAMNGQALFTAFTGDLGRELYRTDGTTSGTVLAQDICAGEKTGFTIGDELVAFNGSIYSLSNRCDASTQRTLIKTDGTQAGTILLNVGTNYLLAVAGNRFYFAASDSRASNQLWVTDGTAAGTVPVMDPVSGKGISAPSDPLVVGDSLYFSTRNSATPGFWRTDGTPAGTVKLIAFPSDGSYYQYVNQRFIYLRDGVTSGSEVTGSELWAQGVNDAAPIQLPVRRNATSSWVTNGNVAYFTGSSEATGKELWKTDGTIAGTTVVRDIVPGPSSSEPQSLVMLGDTVYFTANHPDTGKELWRSDGTAAGTVMVAEVVAGPISGMSSHTIWPLPRLGKVLFVGTDPPFGTELWATDGTAGGTLRLTDIAPGPESSAPISVFHYQDQILFGANDGVHGFELFTFPTANLDDLQPPQVSCPANVSVEAPTEEGMAVTFGEAIASDSSGLPTELRYSKISGSVFATGTTRVEVTATDAAGHTSKCGFDVTVHAPGEGSPEARGGCGGCTSVDLLLMPMGWLLLVMPLRRRGRRNSINPV